MLNSPGFVFLSLSLLLHGYPQGLCNTGVWSREEEEEEEGQAGVRGDKGVEEGVSKE